MTDLKLLIDTNVWLDFFIDRSALHDKAGELITEAHRRNALLFTPITAMKDIYFLLGVELKRMQREANGDVSDSFARAIDEIAWSCIAYVRKQSVIVGADQSDMIEAIAMRPNHPDFEDNMIASAARRAQASYIVTSDKQFAQHSPVSSLNIEEAIALLRQ